MPAKTSLTPELTQLVDSLIESEWFLAGGALRNGLVMAAKISPQMVETLVEEVGPGWERLGTSEKSQVFQTLIQESMGWEPASRRRALQRFLTLAIAPGRETSGLAELSVLHGNEEAIHGTLAVADYLRKQPVGLREQCAKLMIELTLAQLLNKNDLRGVRVDHPQHPLGTALDLLEGTNKAIILALAHTWVDRTLTGDVFNIPSPHAGDVLARLVRAGVDPNTCLQYAMNQPRFSDEDIGLVVGWCLDEGADYQHVLQSERLSPALQAIVESHPSYRRDALGSLVERQDTPGRRTAL